MNNPEPQKKDVRRFQARISGEVQGVFFRDTTLKKAEQLNISGWVRNTNNGCVEVAAEGHRGDLEGFIEFLNEGPLRAKVENVDVKWEEPEGERGFTVKF